MVTVFDVAAYILKHAGQMPHMKLQKLVYYSQAWSLVWDEKPLFRARIEAWANGPVVPQLYRQYRGEYLISACPDGDWKKLNATERETVDAVLDHYGDKPSQWLSALTHRERPWKDARAGIPDGEPSQNVITHAAMADYYESLA